MKIKKTIQVTETIDMIICNTCGKELESNEATPIKIVVGGYTYFTFHLCKDHWTPLLDQLQALQIKQEVRNSV